MALVKNVLLNPLRDRYNWQGQTMHGGDPGLQLWVRSSITNGMVQMGEIAAQRFDMWYGSYRVAMKVTNVSGTCGAFFWVRKYIMRNFM
jgi:hypothetical protein